MKKWQKIKCCLTINMISIFLLIGCLENKGTITSQNNNMLDAWIGNYEFYEYFPPNINMEYNINIYHDNKEYFANIYVNGFQTNKKIKAQVKGDKERIDLIFKTYLPKSTGESIDEGEILLTFKKENSDIYTYWQEIQPILPENSDSGKLYFTKVK
ncbi:MAG: DUF5991 domain-containing protein [Halanaerobiales bacterium]